MEGRQRPSQTAKEWVYAEQMLRILGDRRQGQNVSRGKLPRGMCVEPVLRLMHGAGGRGWSMLLPFDIEL